MTPACVRAVCFNFHDTLAVFDPPRADLCLRAAIESGASVSAGQIAAAREEGAHGPRGWSAFATPLGTDHEERSRDERTYRELRFELTGPRVRAIGFDADADAITDRLLELEEDPRHFRLFDDVLPSFEALAARELCMAVVSNHFWRLPEVASGLGLDPYLEAVVTSARIGYRKPHPRIFEAALDALEVDAGEVLFVGDNAEHDVTGPQRVRMHALLLDRGACESGDGVVRALADLLP